MVLVLTGSDILRLGIEAVDVIQPLETAFRDVAMERVEVPLRRRLYVEPSNDKPMFWLNNIMGASPSLGVAVTRLQARMSTYVETDTGRRKLPDGGFSGLVFLWDLRTCELLAILQDHEISNRRVAATSAIGIRLLAREDSRVLGLIGTGHQASQHLKAICSVRPIDEVRVYSQSPKNREKFVEDYADSVSASVQGVDSASKCLHGADIVCTATSSRTPVFDGSELRPGVHVTSIVGSDRNTRGTEIDLATVVKADRVVTNLRGQIELDGQPKLLRAVESGHLQWEEILELSELLVHPERGRQSDDEVTLHDNNTGMGIQFAAAGLLIYERARDAGLGVQLDPGLFWTSPS